MFPSESTIVAGALGEDKGEPVPFMQDSKIQGTPAAESTRVPLRASTGKREAMGQKKPLTPDQLLEMEQTVLYKALFLNKVIRECLGHNFCTSRSAVCYV